MVRVEMGSQDTITLREPVTTFNCTYPVTDCEFLSLPKSRRTWSKELIVSSSILNFVTNDKVSVDGGPTSFNLFVFTLSVGICGSPLRLYLNDPKRHLQRERRRERLNGPAASHKWVDRSRQWNGERSVNTRMYERGKCDDLNSEVKV